MSAGAFINTRYQVSYSSGVQPIHPIRVQPEVISATIGDSENTPTASPANNPISAVVSLGKNQKGLRPRMLSIRLMDGQSVTGYQPRSVTKIVVFGSGTWDNTQVGDNVNYLGASWEVTGKLPEIAR